MNYNSSVNLAQKKKRKKKREKGKGKRKEEIVLDPRPYVMAIWVNRMLINSFFFHVSSMVNVLCTYSRWWCYL